MPRYDPSTGQLETYQPGPFDSIHYVLQWGGKLPGNEGWSCSLRFALTGETVVVGDTHRTAIKDAVQAFHVSPSAKISALAKLSFVKFNQVGVDGKYTSQATQEILVADVAGGVNEVFPKHPHQTAWAVSLTTGFSRGIAHRGRFYAPLPSCTLEPDGLVGLADVTGMRNQANTLLTALNAAVPGLEVAVFSRKQGAPAHRKVTGIEVGRVLDTQRRRRRKLNELYV